jgi:hypothetical protein
LSSGYQGTGRLRELEHGRQRARADPPDGLPAQVSSLHIGGAQQTACHLLDAVQLLSMYLFYPVQVITMYLLALSIETGCESAWTDTRDVTYSNSYRRRPAAWTLSLRIAADCLAVCCALAVVCTLFPALSMLGFAPVVGALFTLPLAATQQRLGIRCWPCLRAPACGGHCVFCALPAACCHRQAARREIDWITDPLNARCLRGCTTASPPASS